MTASGTAKQIELCIEALNNCKIHHVILIGGGGSGKSYAVNEALRECKTNYLLWNDMELPMFCFTQHGFFESSNKGVITKVILLKSKYDDMVKFFENNHKDSTIIIQF